jgi:hypothetical protein
MRSTKFYPTKVVSSFALLLLCLFNVLNVAAQDSPNITPPADGTCMPLDADGVGTVYKYTYTGGGSTPVWSTRGQIAIVGGNTGTSVNIKSTGYGKGRLYVTFNQAGCAGSQREYIDVFKQFVLPVSNNKIVGPPCVVPNEKVTYSINPVVSTSLTEEIGIDSYEWQLPTGWTIDEYKAGDKSSITITVPSTLNAESYTLGVKVGKCNPEPYLMEIKPAMTVPVISPVPAGCLATGATELVLKIDNFNSAYAYKWMLPSSSNWSFASGYKGTESEVKIIVDNAAYSIVVQATRGDGLGCNTVTSLPFEVKRSMPAGSRIDGPACVNGSDPGIYTIKDASGNTLTGGFTWTYTPNNSLVRDANFSVTDPSGPSVSFTAGTSSGVLSATSKGCSGSVVSLPITIGPAQPVAITGPTCVNASSRDHVYSIDAVPGATSYDWSLGPGLSSPSTLINGGTSIIVHAGNISGSKISVVAKNGTCPSLARQITVNLNAVAPNATLPITSNKTCVNRGSADQITYTVAFNATSPAPNGQTYEWRVIYPTGVSTGWTVNGTNGSTITPTTGPSITYTTNIANNAPTGTYRVEARAVRAGCAASGWVSSASPTVPPFIRVSAQPIWEVSPEGDSTRMGDVLVATVVANATYRWTRTLPGGTPQLLANETTATVDMTSLDPSGATATYHVTAILKTGGCTSNTASTTSQFFPTPAAARVSSEQMSPEQLSSQVTVFPNPTSSGEFTLHLPTFTGKAAVVLKNMQGQIVYKTEVSNIKSKLSAGKLNSGVYLLQVSLNGKVVTKKLSVKK